MRIFKPKYRDKKTGKLKSVSKHWIELRDDLYIVRRFPGFTNKSQSEALGKQIEQLVSCRISGDQPNPELTRWLEGIPNKFRERFAKIGLIDPTRAAAGKPLGDHLEDFRKSLGDTTKHAKHTANTLRRIFDACQFRRWTDISASRLFNYLSDLKNKGNTSQRTFNHALKAAKQFARWMVKDGRASTSPIEHLKNETITIRVRQRRAIELDELRRLLEVTQTSEPRFGMTGHERHLLYRLAVETGLRANELRTLKVSAFDFQNCSVTVLNTNAKNKKEAILPLRADTAILFQSFFIGKLPGVRVFKVPQRTAEMLQADLAQANIDYIDESDRVFDFHALRGQCGSFLAASGVHPKVAQTIMRHSDINLTMNSYTHILQGQESKAVASLPDLSFPSKQKQAAMATGTDGKNNDLASGLAVGRGKQQASMDSGGQGNETDESKNRILNGRYRNRTCDPLIKSQLLYRLS